MLWIWIFIFSVSAMHPCAKKYLREAHQVETKTIVDRVSRKKNNTTLSIVRDKKNKIVGFYREFATSTGCDSACLPFKFVLFFDQDKKFLKLESSEGLTKRYHEPFTPDDYLNLDIIIRRNPPSFKKIKNPLVMVDALSGETLKAYQKDVVKAAAYTTLRVSQYLQSTIKHLNELYP